MKIGFFFELQLPKPYDKDTWNPDGEHRIYKETLEQIELADQLGFDYIFEVEHHHFEEYAHTSAPEIVLAGASQRTKTIRLGHGITLTPPPYNPPGRIAERIAALDLVSDGRVEFGTGESSTFAIGHLRRGSRGVSSESACYQPGVQSAVVAVSPRDCRPFARHR